MARVYDGSPSKWVLESTSALACLDRLLLSLSLHSKPRLCQINLVLGRNSPFVLLRSPCPKNDPSNLAAAHVSISTAQPKQAAATSSGSRRNNDNAAAFLLSVMVVNARRPPIFSRQILIPPSVVNDPRRTRRSSRWSCRACRGRFPFESAALTSATRRRSSVWCGPSLARSCTSELCLTFSFGWKFRVFNVVVVPYACPLPF